MTWQKYITFGWFFLLALLLRFDYYNQFGWYAFSLCLTLFFMLHIFHIGHFNVPADVNDRFR